MSITDIRTPLVEVVNLKKHFKLRGGGKLHAVDGINLKIYPQETVGVVGESGCGKSTLGRSIIRLIEPTSGQILYNGRNLMELGGRKMRELRKELQVIFQDPYSSLDPRKSVIEVIAEYMFIHRQYKTRAETYNRASTLMDLVGLARRYANSYPHELDGGRRQRVGIARALSLNPKFIVCDEPVSALDVSIQAQILNLLMDLEEELGLTYLFITHDMSVVKHISNKIMVMYLGQCVEIATSDELFANPKHPYTKALLSAIPLPDLSTRNKDFVILRGEVSNPINVKPGCRFAKRCDYCTEACTAADPEAVEVSPDHFVSCILIKKGSSLFQVGKGVAVPNGDPQRGSSPSDGVLGK
jgi:oligopeptide/dipeptide ABC transporter ATP-binding protein